ncbi:ankyrin repeat domain-containing protein [Pusillimonas sp. MFBS29]|uniref:ankyrin repeat domain-containing protein n=1 Tax=Pusillimonas sp. MFBS29 TaxID=2886690 RepID=UPI001D11454C|nr:ankyrin repeat domain-containing protein [Pusillimonas sp. MFBS29]MCC2595552.1 ankyrin repeat domain-containing protein [Pusillimonas sp. MFBS29]
MTSHHTSRIIDTRQFYCLILCLLAGLVLSGAALAANPANWWNDIANDRVSEVKKALSRGADPNSISPDGQPAIMQAIRDGSWKVYDLLAANPKTVRNAINVNRETPLMYLAVAGETQRAQDLINRGALVNRLGWTPLQYAASKGHLETVRMLVANKAIVNAPGPDGTTALMMAAYAGSEPVVQYLLDVGADVTMKTTQQYDAAFWARLKNHNTLAGKLDALSAKVMAERSGQRGTGAGQTMQASKPAPQASVKKPSDNSTSRYFDLDRFNENPEP